MFYLFLLQEAIQQWYDQYSGYSSTQADVPGDSSQVSGEQLILFFFLRGHALSLLQLSILACLQCSIECTQSCTCAAHRAFQTHFSSAGMTDSRVHAQDDTVSCQPIKRLKTKHPKRRWHRPARDVTAVSLEGGGTYVGAFDFALNAVLFLML